VNYRLLLVVWLLLPVCLAAQSDPAPAETLAGLLSATEPATVTAPADFTGISGIRRPLFSTRGYSWTGVRLSLQGLNTTDPYQPGRVMFLPDLAAMSDVAVRTASDSLSTAHGSEIALIPAEPGAAWHGRLSSGGTGSSLASSNLPAAQRGLLRQSEHYHWFTRDSAVVSGPLGRRADLLLAGTGQWA